MERFILKCAPETANPIYPLYFIASEPPDKLVLRELVPGGGQTFTFILGYCSPPDHFGEILRYRNELDFAAGRNGSFTGNAVIDLSQWTNDADSPFLDAFLAYLFDHGEKVRYVFTAVSGAESEGQLYRKLCEYFPVETLSADLCSAEFLNRHIRKVFGERIAEKLAQKDIDKLCKCLSMAAGQYDLSLHPLETACERLIMSKEGKLTGKDIDKFMTSDYFTKLCSSGGRQFGIPSTEERW
jgi:hypothetical protein